MIKVSDYIFQHLVQHYGIRHCFLVTGGGAMHLNDSLGASATAFSSQAEAPCT